MDNLQSKINKKFLPLYTTKKRYIVLTGGRACFLKGQSVVTSKGYKDISKLQKGDLVKSYNESSKTIQFKKVTETFIYPSDSYIEIKLKNGTLIKVTPEHKFYFKGGWVKVKDIVSLWHERNMEKNIVVQNRL